MANASPEEEEEDEEFIYEGESEEDYLAGLRTTSSSDMIIVKQKPIVLSTEECFTRMRSDVDEVAGLLKWNSSRAQLLLRHFWWNKDRAKEIFFDDPEGACKACGISPDDEAALTMGTPGQSYECGACWDDVSGPLAASLSCRHWFCTTCWRRNLKYRMDTEGINCVGARCLKTKCGKACSEGAFLQIFPPGDPYRERYERYLLEDYVSKNDKLCFCPKGGCTRIIYCPHGRTPVPCQPVKCDCGLGFCFLCKEEIHAPANCDMLRRWLKKEQDESETANWLVVNTKTCPNPRCGKVIFKDGGCNQVTCLQCKFQWCWVCDGDWATHSDHFRCNNYKPNKEAEDKRNTAREELRKYIHYYTRYRNHDQSKKLDEGVLAKTRKRIAQEVQATHGFLGELDYLEDTARTLISCRFMLKYSYVYAYFLAEAGSGKILFESNQAQLEHWTELLSGYVEDRTGKFQKSEVVGRTSTANVMLKKLAEGRYDE